MTGACPGRQGTSQHLTPPGRWCARDHFSLMNVRSDVSILRIYTYEENVRKWSSSLSHSLIQVCELHLNMQREQPWEKSQAQVQKESRSVNDLWEQEKSSQPPGATTLGLLLETKINVSPLQPLYFQDISIEFAYLELELFTGVTLDPLLPPSICR